MYHMKKYYGQVVQDRKGYIDIYAVKEDVYIAIEFDNRLWLGWKSFQKLLQSDDYYSAVWYYFSRYEVLSLNFCLRLIAQIFFII